VTRLSRALPVVVFLLASVVFLPSLDGQFLNWDDKENLFRTTAYRGLGVAQLRWMFTATVLGHYIPLTWLSFGINYALGGMNPWGYHLLNLLLHGANAVLFYWVARRLLLLAAVGGIAHGQHGDSHVDSGDKGVALRRTDLSCAAAFAALVFAVHPLRVESVAWVTERRDVLCGFFFLLAVLAWLRAVERPGGPDRRWALLSLASFTASLLSKAAAMPLPAVLVLLDVYPLGRLRALGWRRVLLEKIPHAALAAAAAVLALVALRISTVRVTSYAEYGPAARAAMIAYSLVFYPWKFLWPNLLSPLYELPVRIDPFAGQFLVPIVALIAVTAALVVLRDRWPAGLAAWIYSALLVLPVSGAVHAGFQLAHDRYSYLSGLGFAVLAGAALARVLSAGRAGRLRPPIVVLLSAVALLVVGIWGAESWRQSRVWHDSETLWRWAVDVDPACALCHNNLGSVILETPPFTLLRAASAEGHFREAIRLRPERPNAYQNLGAALAAQTRYAEAEAAFREFMRKYPEAVSGPGSLGVLLLQQGRYVEAVSLLRQAHGMQPEAPELRVALGAALRARAAELVRQRKRDEAIALLKEAAAVEPGAQRSTTSAR
jgi:hypothetical protein